MDTNGHELVHGDLCYQIVGAAMEVHRTLGSAFLEKVYENALGVVLGERGIEFAQQAPINVHFHDKLVGVYVVDILVCGEVILELKTVDRITDVHRAQAINYLKATGLRLAITINFANAKLEWERIVA